MPIVDENQVTKRRRVPLWALCPALLVPLIALVLWSFYKPVHVPFGRHDLIFAGTWGGSGFGGFIGGPNGSWVYSLEIPGWSGVYLISCDSPHLDAP
jgi:hypothetical protein